MNCDCHTHGYDEGHYVLPPLPYDATALEPLIDGETVTLHHDRHHAAYVAGANQAQQTLHAISIGECDISHQAAATQALAFNLAGHILHSCYWRSMAPTPINVPAGAMADAIHAQFQNYENFLRLFRNICLNVKGSGWGVLGIDSMSKKLLILAIERHEDVLSPGFTPLIACDVWEHAYYLRYHNNRAAYIDAFIQMMDWTHADKKYRALCNCQ